MIYELIRDPALLVLAVPAVLAALVCHEWAHAWAAVRFGDPMPRAMGRLTLDPRAHLDFLGTLMLLFAGFGWARPVSFQPHRLRPRFLGEIAVYSAGVVMNILLAVASAVLAALVPPGLLREALHWSVSVNTGLAAFNFVPVPPLDGYRVLSRLIPGFSGSRVGRFLDETGMFLLALILFLAPGLFRTLMAPILAGISLIIWGAAGLVLGLWS